MDNVIRSISLLSVCPLHRARRVFLALSVLLISLSCLVSLAFAAPSELANGKTLSAKNISDLNVPFIKNDGQIDERVSFYARTFAGTVFIAENSLTYSLLKHVGKKSSEPLANSKSGPKLSLSSSLSIKERFVGGKAFKPDGLDQVPTVVNYFVGTRKNWRSSIPSYGKVSLGPIWPNIAVELKAYSNNVEKLFFIRPGGTVSDISVEFEGIEGLRVAESGQLIIKTAVGEVSMTEPIAYQDIHGDRRKVRVSYQVSGNSYTFRVGDYDKRETLVIDPLLASTFLGSDGSERAEALVLNESGAVYVTGCTSSNGYPTTAGSYDTNHNGGATDVFVSKLNSDLTTLLTSTFLGGSSQDCGEAIVLDPSGNVYVAGYTYSTNFPTTAIAYDASHNGGTTDVFVSKLNSDLSTLVASTYLGGSSDEYARGGIALDSSQNVFVVGYSHSSDFPTTSGSYDETFNGTFDAFVSRLDNNLSTLSASTFLGGSGGDVAYGMAIDASQNIILVGSASTGYPTTAGAYDTTSNGSNDAFVSKMNGNLVTLLASTFVGGSGQDDGKAIALDPSGNIYIAGDTFSSNYPTTFGAYSTIFNGGLGDAFVSKLNGDLTTLSASTYLGGSDGDYPRAITVESSQSVFVTGSTYSSDYPTTLGAYDTEFFRDPRGFVSKLDTSLETLTASTFLGSATNPSGPAENEPLAVALDSNGSIFILGYTTSNLFPTTGAAYDTTHNGSTDAFISKLTTDLSGLPVVNVTSPSPNGTYSTGDTIPITVQFADLVAVNISTGTPTLDLNCGGNATYSSGDGTDTLTFTYIVAQGDNTPDLDYTSEYAIILNGGVIGADLLLPPPGKSHSLAANKNITVDTLAPAAPVIIGPSDGTITNNSSPTISGTAEINSIVALFADGSSLGTTTANTSGNWSFTPSSPLSDGNHTLTAKATDAGGNSSSASDIITITIDTIAPDAPTILAPTTGTITNDNTPSFSGTADANCLIGVFSSSTLIGETYADSSGNWSLTPTSPGLDMTHTITAKAADTAGNISVMSSPIVITIDTAPPTTPNITSPTNGTFTSNNSPTISGTAEENSFVEVFANGQSLGTITANGSGTWSLAPSSPLANNTYALTATATDVAGNTSSTSATVNITIGNSSISGTVTIGGPAQFTLQSESFLDTGIVPEQYSGNGDNLSPPLYWCHAPANTKSYALIMSDPDAPVGTWVHWIVYDIPSNIVRLAENTGAQGGGNLPAGAKHGTNSWFDYGISSGNYYQGPQPPPGETHRYYVDIFALDVASLNLNPSNVSANDIMAAMNGHILEIATTLGTYPNAIPSLPSSSSSYPLPQVSVAAGLLGTQSTDSCGHYGFSNIPLGTEYVVSPSKAGYSFNPSQRLGTLSGYVEADFIGSEVTTYTLSGRIVASGAPLAGVTVDGGVLGTMATDAAGVYSFTSVPDGTNYTLTPSKVDFTFEPSNISGVLTKNTTADFEGSAATTVPSDSDGDGVSDDQEVLDGTNPNDRGSCLSVLSTTLCSEWNGFLGGMWNIMEHVNMSTSPVQVHSVLYSIDGVPKGTADFQVSPGAQQDLLVHAIDGWIPDSYGKVCSTVSGEKDGSLDGRMVYYKALDVASTSYDFAFAMPFLNGTTGGQFVTFNTFQPSLDPADAQNIVANWIQLTNLESTSQQGILTFFAQDGTELGTPVQVSLDAGARQDFSGHQFGPNLVGIIRWQPMSNSAKFQLRNVRYFYDNPLGENSFDTAFQLEGLVGTGELIAVPLDTNQASSILEVANTTDSSQAIAVAIYRATGDFAKSVDLTLPAFGSEHIITDTILNGESGIATIRGTSPEGVIAVAMQYGRTVTAGLQYMYGVPARQPLGTTLRSSYNTFLQQNCKLLIVNPTSVATTATIAMVRYDGKQILSDESVTVPGYGLIDYNMCANEPPDYYGVATVHAAEPNTLVSTVVRLGVNDDYRFPTPVRQ